MSLSVGGLLLVFATCLILSYLGKRREGKATTYRERIRDALVKLARDLAWASLAAVGIILVIEAALYVDPRNSTIDEMNAFIATANEYLKWSWAVVLLLTVTALVAFARVRNELAQANARAVGRAAKGSGVLKGLFALLATSSFVGAEANGSVPVKLGEATAARADLRRAELLLFQHAQIALLREAIAGSLAEAESRIAPVQATSTAYAATASLVGPTLGGSAIDLNDVRPEVPTTGFEPLDNTTLQDVENRTESIGTASASEAEKEKEKLVNDIVKIAFGRSSGAIKAQYLELGNPILDSLLSAFTDTAVLDPLREMAAKQANRLIRNEIDFRKAAANMRDLGRGVALRLAARWTDLPTPALHSDFGNPEWDVVRDRTRELGRVGIPGKSAELQEEARRVVQDTDRMQANVKRLLFATRNRNSAEEAAFARYIRANPAYAALWGYMAISVPPARLERQLREISVQSNTKKARQFQQAIVQANEGDAGFAQVLREQGFDPVADRNLSLAQMKSKLFDVHGPYPVDGYSLYFLDTGLGPVEAARAYYQSDRVGYWVGRICPQIS